MSDSTVQVRVERCDFCGGTRRRLLAEVRDLLLGLEGTYQIQQCVDCGLVFVDPRPEPAEIGRFYPPTYDEYQDDRVTRLRGWERLQGRPGGPKGWFERLRVLVGQNEGYHVIPVTDGPGTILDVGCANGTLLDKMKLLGWTTYGFELSPIAAEIARNKGHQVTLGSIDGGLPYPDETFDCVYCWHVLEHTFSPRNALGEIHRVLKPGGQLVMAVPNFHSFQARMFGRYWSKIEAPRHLFQFTRRTLGAYLDERFVQVRVSTRTGAASWWKSLRCLANGTLGTRWSRDPAWVILLMEVPVFLTGLFRYFGVGAELRCTCVKPTAAAVRAP